MILYVSPAMSTSMIVEHVQFGGHRVECYFHYIIEGISSLQHIFTNDCAADLVYTDFCQTQKNARAQDWVYKKFMTFKLTDRTKPDETLDYVS